jgi:hydroxymethylpyrimidine/phosphomethylpyrimidine kinase
MDIGHSKSLLHLRVATAPCLLGYGEMAIKLKNDPRTVKDKSNPYWEWILHYADPGFQSAVTLGRDVLEQMVLRDPPSVTSFQTLKQIFKKVSEDFVTMETCLLGNLVTILSINFESL